MVPSSSSVVVGGGGAAGGAADDGEYERTLVLDLCAPGGTRAVPPKDALDSFCGLAVNLDPELVVPVLLQQLGPDAEHAGSWQAKSKALAVMGALLKTEGCEGHADLMREAVADVAALSNAKPVTLGAKVVSE